jgi:hypothetical protein
MSSIGAMSGGSPYVPTQAVGQPAKPVRQDHDGDNDAKATQTSEATESSSRLVDLKA